MVEPADYDDLTVPELKELARDSGVEGYSTLNRDDLTKLLADNDVLAPTPEDEEWVAEPVPEEDGETEAPDEESEDGEDEEGDEAPADAGDEDPTPEPQEQDEGEEEAPEEEEAPDPSMVRTKLYASHPTVRAFIEERVDHPVRAHKRYTLDLPQDEYDAILEEAGGAYVRGIIPA